MFVVSANAWMNTPAGIELAEGRIVGVHPLEVMLNPSAVGEVVHMVLAAFLATGFLVAGIHAWHLLKEPDHVFHQRACTIALGISVIPAILQPISGDLLAQHVAVHQPAKLAAFEAHFHTQAGSPFHLGGLPDAETRTVPVVHLAFQLMVGSGFVLMGVAMWSIWRKWRHTAPFRSRAFLWSLVAVSPLGFFAIEAGWVVTEVGRQPWIISGIMRTTDAVTPMPGLIVTFTMLTLVYLALGAIVVWLIGRHVAAIPHQFHAVASPEGRQDDVTA